MVEDLWRRTKESSSGAEKILAFRHFLLGIRGRVLKSGASELTYDEVADCISTIQTKFQDAEAREGQVVRKRTIRSVVNKKAGWWYAALAVLQVGLPECGDTSDIGVATEHVCTIAEFVSETMCWLQSFAVAILQRCDTDEYQQQLRRTGSRKYTSGLTEEEREIQARIREARWKLTYGKRLAREAHRQYRSRDWMYVWEQGILDDYTSGALSDSLQTMLAATRTNRGVQTFRV